jgi:hypothetical protein
VLSVCAAAGEAESATLVERWTGQAARFEKAWKERLASMNKQQSARHPNRVVNFDDVVFGDNMAPSLLPLHPRFLAMAYDPAWSEKLRKRLVAELAPIVLRCPWLGEELGNPLKMAPADLLVAEALLPPARKAAAHEEQVEEQKRAASEDESKELREEFQAILSSLHRHLRSQWFSTDDCDLIEAAIAQHEALLERLRAGSQAMPAWAALTKQAARVEPALLRLRELLDDLGRRRTVNTRWLNWGLGLGLLFMIVFIPKSFGVWPPYAMSAAGLSVIAWRLLPLWQLMGQLRELGQTLPTQARASE